MSRRYDKPWANWFWGPASIDQADRLGRALHSSRVPADYLAEQIAGEMARMLVDDIRKFTGE